MDKRKHTTTVTTYLVPLRSRIAAGVRHKPPRHIKATALACQQKGCVAILVTPVAAAHITIEQAN
jgi:hypothetical protein